MKHLLDDTAKVAVNTDAVVLTVAGIDQAIASTQVLRQALEEQRTYAAAKEAIADAQRTLNQSRDTIHLLQEDVTTLSRRCQDLLDVIGEKEKRIVQLTKPVPVSKRNKTARTRR